ncbi:amino acid adenylation domain-containing protein [Pseudomonas sp. P9_35]|uniref:non-ribosomal peptide synthetase n=1 Tax=unclassified Pseudomonas TaxID=196821 RepID=UPI002A35992D|nr:MULTISPECIES: non-ribosomal peptide synthetase [unclassified Pseudomonas]WPN65837.1 amino acid adenylation domain-containing protein [Pseudomonas sp. P9_32]WPN71587.1 amino acid adenylation domain-containing protein [Pseudomonas sp. P9_35]
MHDQIENIYSLTPLQKGLLYHEAYAPESRVYYQQMNIGLAGELDLAAFRLAWVALMQRHAVLRTAFLWEELDDAYQVILKEVDLPLREVDLRGHSQGLAALAAEDHAQAFELGAAPLMRLTLARLDDVNGQAQWSLVWTHHHLLLDGWSVGSLLADWRDLYRAARRGQHASLETVRPFQDYVAYLSERPSSDDFWHSRLADFANTTRVPESDPRGLVADPVDARLPCTEHSLRLDAATTARLAGFARNHNLTVNTLLQAAYAYLLGRHNGSDESLIGVTVAGRPQRLSGVERMVGLFINTLPLRVRWDDAPTVGQWLAGIQDWNAEMREHEHTPLASLRALTALPPGGELFEAIIVFENFPFPRELDQIDDGLFGLPDAEHAAPLRHTGGRNNYPMSLIASMESDCLQLHLVHQRKRLSDAAGARLLQQLAVLVEELSLDANRPLADVPLCPVQELQLTRHWGNGAPLPLPDAPLHALIAIQARRHPEREAVRDANGALSYGELLEASTGLANALRQRGLQQGDRVALALPRNNDAVISLLAVMQAGGCFLPLDLGQPASRLSALIASADVDFIIGTPAFESACVQVIEASARATGIDLPAADQQACAYVIYTSGSTGTPKGVRLSHRAIVAYITGILAELGCAEAKQPWRHALLSTLAADLGYTQLFGALVSGGSLLLVDDDTRADPNALAQCFAEFTPDLVKLTPNHLHGLLAARPDADLLPRRALLLGGEALQGTLLDTLRALRPDLAVYNHYGPTESAVGICLSRIDQPLAGVQPLGRPQPNRQLRVLDNHGHPVPVGVPGELWVGGEGLAIDYLGDPAQTAARFTAVADLPRAYRTGDRVRWLETGELAFLGRVDNQIKLRGYRIELGEVEAQIKRLSSNIQQVLVHVVQPANETPRLVAWLVASTSMSADKLRHDLALRVPDYMVPADFIALDAIPLNANGKPDIARLPLPDAPTRQDTYEAPRDAVESAFVEIWQDVLRVERVGIHDNFFALGGDSILNLQIIARAHQRGMKLTPKQLFENRTIAEISAVISQGTNYSRETSSVARNVPLTAGQHARLEAGPLAADWRCVALNAPISVEVLSRAVLALQQQHRALQVGLVPQADGTWVQTLPATPKPVSASRQSLNTGDSNALAELAETTLARLDHAAGEGWHACLCEQGDAVLLVAHALRLDASSWALLMTDLALAVAQAQYDRAIELPRHGGNLDEWAEYQTTRAKDEDGLEPAWEYWLQYAGEALPSAPQPQGPATERRVRISSSLSARLNVLQRRSHAPWASLVATAVAAELAQQSASQDVWLSLDRGRCERARLPLTSALSRTDFDPATVIGALSHAVPLRLSLTPTASAAQMLAQVDAQLATAPDTGDDYGVLRYLADNDYLREPLLSLPQPTVHIVMAGEWQTLEGPLGDVIAGSASIDAPGLTLSVSLRHGQLHIDCRGAGAERWAEVLEQRLAILAADAEQAIPGAHAFPLCRAAGHELSALGSNFDWAGIDDLLPLSPMQEGMLLHTLLRPNSGIYLMQQRYRWDGELDRSAIEYAWAQQLARHPMLRTGFWWQDGKAALQCVYHDTDPAFVWYDWRHLDEASRQRQLDAVLDAECRQGFDMRRPPLTFLRVFQVADREFLIVRSFHHILTDAWCFGLLMADLFAHYQARVLGQPVARPLLPSFSNYVHWLQCQDTSITEQFWTRELAGFSAPTPLVVDRPATTEQAVETVANLDVTLSIADTRALTALCQQHQLTPNTWIQGAWALLLSRYSGSDDVLFGVTVSGRPTDLPGVEDIVGLFINSLPLRVKVDDEHTVVPWLQALFAHNVELRAYEHAPLVDIQRWSEIEHGRSLFDSLVVFENAPFDAGLSDRQVDFNVDIYEDRVHTNYPMTVVLYPGDRLGIRLTYDAARFDTETVQRMLGHLRQLLTQMVARPDAPLASLSLLTPEERQTLLVDWNRSELDFPLEQTYAELFARQVAAHPQRIAAVCGAESLSYTELDQRANRLARALVETGAGRDTLVALAGERGLPLLSMMIAVLKAGAAYLPLDIKHPPQRLGEILELSGATILLTSDSADSVIDPALAACTATPRRLRTEALWLGDDATPLQMAGSPDDLAYVIFTSGSTGTPKGAMIEQRGMLNNIFGKVPTLGLSSADRIAQTASPAFDISVWQFLAAPILGATVHILPDMIAHDPERLLAALETQQLSVLEAVPTMIRALLDLAGADTQLPALRWLLPTGEALPPALAQAWLGRFAHVPLMNAYGPAECSDDVAFHPLTRVPDEDGNAMPIGRPTANNHLYLVDAQLRPVPVGVPGEICVGGVGVGRGYLNDPEKTRAAFVAHPFEPEARFYRTGDLGRWRADGVIEFLGRRDQQVKIRGHRIELGEIEDHLGRHPAVQAVAVIVNADQRGDLQLVAYWTGDDTPVAVLREWLAQRLPSYMVPAHWQQLETLPLNANGKVDRKELTSRTLDSHLIEQRPLSSDTEQQLGAIWAQILNVPAIGADDNFFALGGHSLLATLVVSRIRSQLAVDLPLRAVFDHPVLENLARAIDSARLQTAPLALPTIIRADRSQALPLSFAQQRLWFLEQLNPGSSGFNIPFALTLTGTLNVEALRLAFEQLVARHEVLRSTVHSDQGEPWQRIETAQAFALPVTDLQQVPAQEREPAIQVHLSEVFGQPFDLTQAPLIRARLLQLDTQTHVLAIALHHIAVDAWSIAQLVDQLASDYVGFGSPANRIDTPPLQYADFAVWQRKHLPGPVWQQQLAYWRQQLQASPAPLLLPGAQTRDLGGCARHRSRLPASLAQAVNDLAKARDASPFMVLHSALNVVLHQQTGREDLLVGTDIANRHQQQTEDMVGFFVNQLVLRCRVTPQQTFAQLLGDARRVALDAFAHQDLPFDALVADLLPQRDARYTPFFQVKLVVQNTRQQDLHLPGLAISERELEPQASDVDLLINVVDDGAGLLVVYDYDTGRYTRDCIELFDSLFVCLLEQLSLNADTDVAQLLLPLNQLQQTRREQAQAALREAGSARQSTLGQARRRNVVKDAEQ